MVIDGVKDSFFSNFEQQKRNMVAMVAAYVSFVDLFEDWCNLACPPGVRENTFVQGWLKD